MALFLPPYLRVVCLVDADLAEPQRAAPYQYGDWRTVGVTTRMCDACCARNKIGLRVLDKNTVVWRRGTVGDKSASVIVYHIHGDYTVF